jgi:hypothetical protein
MITGLTALKFSFSDGKLDIYLRNPKTRDVSDCKDKIASVLSLYLLRQTSGIYRGFGKQCGVMEQASGRANTIASKENYMLALGQGGHNSISSSPL